MRFDDRSAANDRNEKPLVVVPESFARHNPTDARRVRVSDR